MLASVNTCALVGLDGQMVEVQVDIAHQGLPNFFLVGLASTAVKEARERVRTAIKNSGFAFPLRRITVNLAPAELPKTGPSYDLPLALAILVASGQVEAPPADAVFLGELSLDGQLRHTAGVLPMVATARAAGSRSVFVPAMDAAEAALVEGIDVLAVASLGELVAHLRGDLELAPSGATDLRNGHASPEVLDLSEVRGQEHAKRALEIAAAGGHNLLFTGPPGAGKTLLARAVPGILPPMTAEETLEVTRIYSVAGVLPPGVPVLHERPFRAPHHTVSYAGLVGGGTVPRPGEISLAHRGVLFLDEIPEFSHQVLEVMRQPIEDGLVTIARAHGSVAFPAKFMLIAARNPCPCGFYGDTQRPCVCPEAVVTRYQKRLSGPILDRIDLHLSVPRVDFEKLTGRDLGEKSCSIRERVIAARERQWKRFAGSLVTSNAEMRLVDTRTACELDAAGAQLVRTAVDRLGLSARAYHRVLRVARTIADLAGVEQIKPMHLAEAIQYQPRNTSGEFAAER
jgi:magnesium chelatase family protein